jgi:TPR repeat protein
VFEQLAEMYEKGMGVPKDEIKAGEYCLRAGTRGNTHKLHEFSIKGYTDKFKL